MYIVMPVILVDLEDRVIEKDILQTPSDYHIHNMYKYTYLLFDCVPYGLMYKHFLL